MKNKHLVMLLLSSCCLAACVDSKYDLSDVNTDDAVMGESWVAPLGTGYVTSDECRESPFHSGSRRGLHHDL